MKLYPMENWPVQANSLTQLYGQLLSGTIPHAMLFTGEWEATKQLTEYLANALLCKGDTVPCGECESCRQFQAGSHPDFHLVDGSVTNGVKTGDIESLQERLKLRAHTGGRTVYAILGIGQATPVAANRLLKTVEEPAPGVVAMFTSTTLNSVLPTIQSRCFVYPLHMPLARAGWDDASSGSKVLNLEKGENSGFAAIFDGVVQWTQACVMESEPGFVLAESFQKFAEQYVLADVFHILSLWFRDVMHYKLGERTYIRFSERVGDLQKQAEHASVDQLAQAIDLVLDAKSRLQAHVVASINVEQMCIRLRRVFRHV